MRDIRRAAQNSLLAERRFHEANNLTDNEALGILANWDTETLRHFYVEDRLTLPEFEMVLDRKYDL